MIAATTIEDFDKYVEVKVSLQQLNGSLESENIRIESFYVQYDDELCDYVARVFYVVDGSTVDDNIETLDRYCDMAGDSLAEFVEFVHCIYRTRDEYQADFVNDAWNNVLRKVND